MSDWLAQAIDEKLARERELAVKRAIQMESNHPCFYEFFAGGGMARAGLGSGWTCLFANDIDPMKARVYRDNWDDCGHLIVEDVNKVETIQLPGHADLVWASFPCQDLSLAGNYGGIGRWQEGEQTRSGTFWPFWNLMRKLKEEGRAPKLIVLENVYGVLTSNKGQDFSAIASAFSGAGYRFGAMVIDARHFVPQSRPRVFVVGISCDAPIPAGLTSETPVVPWHPNGMVAAYAKLSKEARESWVWWNLPLPPVRTQTFSDLIEEAPKCVKWDTKAQTNQLLAMMSSVNLAKVRQAKNAGRRMVGGVYRRTRKDAQGNKMQRAEVRFDDLAGCLRTPSGGSSRQRILVVDGSKIGSRLLSPREAARLMGLPNDYQLPNNYNDAYHVAGDGVVVPVVRHLAECIFEPILRGSAHIASIDQKVA